MILIDIGCRQSRSMSAQWFFIKIGFYIWIGAKIWRQKSIIL